MATERHEDGFIAGIHNYCDRWCERCPFTSRCRAYAIEMAIAIHGPEAALADSALDPDLPDEEGGPEAMAPWEVDEEPDADVEAEMVRHEAARLLADVHPLAEAAKALATLAGPLIDGAAARLEGAGPDAAPFLDALDVLCHYRFFIAAKVHRALSGRDTEFFDEAGRPLPRDADGSAKIVHITCAAAREAALRLGQLDPGLAAPATAYAEAAGRALALIDEVFPCHRAFRRPGLDDPPMA